MYQLFLAFDGFVPALTVLFPLAVLVAAVSGTVRSNRLRSVSPLHEPLIDAVLVFAVMFTAYLVFYPQPEIAERVRMEIGNDLLTALRAAPGDVRPWVQLAGNLVLLLPMATLVPMRVRWFDGYGKIVIGGLSTALTIEAVQFFCIPGRVASTDDVVLNTLGASMGGLVVCARWWRAEGQLPGPNHRSVEPDEAQTTVWRIIEKIEQERVPGARRNSDAATARVPARQSGERNAVPVRRPTDGRMPAASGPPAANVRAPVNVPAERPGKGVPATAGRAPARRS
ncbi:VanZ family protein [Saccharopolyspora gloriosae]|uniref:VanZ family protein n=1 Tax=Saccharopolyspora gloriosae TaxID=455344 RepID=UPI001FB6919A|nr:VanZ family protein [Saccharopolyspora gloriosae]